MNGCSKSIQLTLTTAFANKEQFLKNKQTEENRHFFIYQRRGGHNVSLI